MVVRSWEMRVYGCDTEPWIYPKNIRINW